MTPRLAAIAIAAPIAAATLVPRTAAAQATNPQAERLDEPRSLEPTSSGLRLGLRAGVGAPIGKSFASSGAMVETISRYVPLRLDVGYRITPHFYVGVNGQFAMLVANNCTGDMQCSGTNVRAGAGAAYHFRPARRLDPWLGLGMGYEWLSVSRSSDGRTTDFSARGLVLADVDVGVDWRASRQLRLGPTVAASIGQYSQIAVNDRRADDFQPALHAWVTLGVRGAFDM